MDYEYFRVEESEQFSFFRIPKALFTEKEFEGLSTDAKLLYGILLDRINLSKKNGWVDADGYVYIIYTVAELQEVLNMSHTTVTKLLREDVYKRQETIRLSAKFNEKGFRTIALNGSASETEREEAFERLAMDLSLIHI